MPGVGPGTGTSGSGQSVGQGKGGLLGGLIIPQGTISANVKAGGRPFRFTYRKLILTRNLL